MKHNSFDLLVVAVITLIAITLAFVVPPDEVPVRILTLPLILVLPGYALIAAMFPERVFGIPERLVFSLGLSLIIVILGGLALNITPFGLHASSWAVLLGGITLGAISVALVRRRGEGIAVREQSRRWNIGLSIPQGVLIGLAVIVLSGAVVMSFNGATKQPRPGFTQLWILPASGANAKNAVQLGLSNMELTTTKYLLEVDVNGQIVKVWPSIHLKPNEKWETTLVVQQAGQLGTAKVEVLLYRSTSSTLYRHVLLWLGA